MVELMLSLAYVDNEEEAKKAKNDTCPETQGHPETNSGQPQQLI